jgi:S1-C subfamily serine protease
MMLLRTLRNLTARFCLTVAVLFGSAGVSFALPDCPSDQFLFNCFGTRIFTNGNEYVGEFQNDKRNGQGTFTYADGEEYVGGWKNNNEHGQGTFTYADGDEYVGGWKNGKKHGQGTYTYTDGDKYVGGWKNGKQHGQGTATFIIGSKYVGEYKYGKKHGQGTYTHADGTTEKGIWKMGVLQYAQKKSPAVTARKSPAVTARKSPQPKSGTSGSGFFISKQGHIITNQHVVNDCNELTVGDSALKQVAATVLETDRRNDLALLKISSTVMASAETKSLIQKLGISIEPKSGDSTIPLSSNGLMRAEDVELGEDLLVAGYPYGKVFSDTIKVTKGIVSANRGLGDDTGQFQMDAAVQPGNSGGPIYDENGNIVGVVVSQLNKMKFAKSVGSIPENVNFGIKASTVRQFLSASGLPTKWSKRSKSMSTKDLAKIAKMQTVMVMCYR